MSAGDTAGAADAHGAPDRALHLVRRAWDPVPPDRVAAAVEAVLLVTDEPVPAGVLAEALGVEGAAVAEALGVLGREYDENGHGFGLQHLSGGWRLATRPEFASVLERHLGAGQQVRLTQAAVEALTIVAYQQPVTRGQVSAVRGVASDGVLRTLVARGVVEVRGTDDSGALRYATTPLFLDRLGLDSLDDLPPLAPHLPDLAELEPTLTEPAPPAGADPGADPDSSTQET